MVREHHTEVGNPAPIPREREPGVRGANRKGNRVLLPRARHPIHIGGTTHDPTRRSTARNHSRRTTRHARSGTAHDEEHTYLAR